MKKCLLPLFLCVGLALPSCSDTEAILANLDTDTLDRIEAMESCFPINAQKVAALLELAQAWATTEEAPDGIDVSLNGDQIEVQWNLVTSSSPCRITMSISFHGPDGVQITADQLDLGSANPTDLDSLMDKGVTNLAGMFPGEKPFVMGRFGVSNPLVSEGWSGDGTLTGIIGGSTNQNELEEIRTTTDTPAGGPPPVAPASVADPSGCSLTFQTTGIRTDDQPGQEYPSGVITFSVASPLITVNGSITMNATVIAIIQVDGIPGNFEFNLDTLRLSGPN
jgi:hypothetical protein